MSEFSGHWTTDAVSPVGHQVASYTQATNGTLQKIMAACSAFEGVAPNYLNALAGTVTGANTVAINTGGAMVDGKAYENNASLNVNIPSASAGNTRIDRIVLRADWAGFILSVHRIAGVDSGSPTAPAITQTPGTTYDIMLYQALVDAAGTVTLTDERVMAALITHRQGGSATDWSANGTGNYVPADYMMQTGAAAVTVASGIGDVTVNFPVAFSNVPVVLGTVLYAGGAFNPRVMLHLYSVNVSAAKFKILGDDGLSTWDGAYTVFWQAIGPM